MYICKTYLCISFIIHTYICTHTCITYIYIMYITNQSTKKPFQKIRVFHENWCLNDNVPHWRFWKHWSLWCTHQKMGSWLQEEEKLIQKVLTSGIEHQQENWRKTLILKELRNTLAIFMQKSKWTNPKTLAISLYMCTRKVSRTSGINNLRAPNERDKTFRVLNRDNDNYITASLYRPSFIKMGKYWTVNVLA